MMDGYTSSSSDETAHKLQSSEEHKTENLALKMMDTVAVFKIGHDLYQNKELWQPYGSRGAFGGQLVAQALNASWDTVPEGFSAHSLHAHFLLACDAKLPIAYHVQRIRDGRSFATRMVTAKQNDTVFFICTCSFTTPDRNTALRRQSAMPNVAEPGSLLSEKQVYRAALDEAYKSPEKFPKNLLRRVEMRVKEELPIEYRQLDEVSAEVVINGIVKPSPNTRRWFRARGNLGQDQKLHTLAVAYASDSHFLNSAARANGYNYSAEHIGMMTSLDHTIWFHEPVKADEFLLYDMCSPQSNYGRAMVFGKIYSQDGRLIASTAQEGLLRLSKAGQAYHQKIRDNKL
ncbi:thioesterase-like superfamily-domain-containing protein [Blakeslea trispora]|nr:thioesterase-like superfamily-domain-containing protein [Blakeslea trispora]